MLLSETATETKTAHSKSQPTRGLPSAAGVPPEILTTIVNTQQDLASIEFDLSQVMQVIVTRARAMADADGAVLMIREGDKLVYRAADGMMEPHVGVSVSMHASLSGLALQQEEALVCTDSETDDRIDRELARRVGVRAMLAVPLYHLGHGVGVLNMLSTKPRGFSPALVMTLKLMAGLLASAINNALELDAKKRLIDAHVTALEAVREREAVLRSFYDSAPFMMGVVELTDDDICHVSVNVESARVSGLEADEFVGRTARELGNSARHVAFWRSQYLHSEKTRAPVTFEYYHGDEGDRGAGRWVSGTVSVVGKGPTGRMRYSYVVDDITKRKYAEYLEIDRTTVLERIARSEPLEPTIVDVIRLVERQVPGAAATMLMLRDGEIQQSNGSTPEALSSALKIGGVGLVAELCDRHDLQPASQVHASDLDLDAVWTDCRGAAMAAGYQRAWSAPIRSADAAFLAMLLVFLPHQRCAQPESAQLKAINVAIKAARIAIDQRNINHLLTHRMYHDVLTSLPNRLLLEDRLNQACLAARRSGEPVALLALDIDKFKQVNDTLGHDAGDALLRQFAERISKAKRESDTLARSGGDEFVLLAPSIDGPAAALKLARRLIETADEPFDLDGRAVHIGVSVGVALFPDQADAPMELLKAADMALYAAKSQGRHRAVLAT